MIRRIFTITVLVPVLAAPLAPLPEALAATGVDPSLLKDSTIFRRRATKRVRKRDLQNRVSRGELRARSEQEHRQLRKEIKKEQIQEGIRRRGFRRRMTDTEERQTMRFMRQRRTAPLIDHARQFFREKNRKNVKAQRTVDTRRKNVIDAGPCKCLPTYGRRWSKCIAAARRGEAYQFAQSRSNKEANTCSE